MLVDSIKRLFKKYVYRSHVHNFVFDATVPYHIDVMGLQSSGERVVYKCDGCGKVIIVEQQS